MSLTIACCHLADMIPAQQVEPASYYSFIDLTNFHHGAERRGQSARARTARRRPRLLQAVDRPSSFLDLDDAQILDHPPHIPSLPFENVHDAGLVSAMPPSLVVNNCERGQGKPDVMPTNGPGLSSGGATSIERITRHGTSFVSVWSPPQPCDLSPEIIPPYSRRAPLCFEDDRLPSYEDAAGSAPVHLGENTVQQIASRFPGSSYRVDRTKVAQLPSSQDPMSPSPNPFVVLPPQRARRPLPPIPRSRQGHVVFTTPLDIGGQPLHVDERNIIPPKCLSKLDKALL